MQKLDRIPWNEVDSSNLNATFYHESSATLCVRFNNGGVYSYITPHEVYEELIHAPSVGSFLHYVVKPFPMTRWEDESELLNHLNVA